MDTFSTYCFILLITLYFSGALTGLIFQRDPVKSIYIPYGLAAAAGLIGTILGIAILLQSHPSHPILIDVPSPVPFTTFSIRLDGLSGFFILTVSLISLAVAIYSIGYNRIYAQNRRVGLLGTAYHLFLLSMILVVTVNDAFFFLIFWEIMSLLSYLLVIYEHDKPGTQKAGFVYLIMTHIGTGFILITFLIFFSVTGNLNFDSFRMSGNGMPVASQALVFLCALIGFGMKAGIIPLHIWLPIAHPVAPSPISALMSAVMIKMGIYGLFRIYLDFLNGGPLWWGGVVVAIGAISSLLGVMYALMEHDIKRLLAYHSVENIGIILLGLGMAMIFLSANQPALAALAAIAGLYHTLNHATFKGLLFLGAGSVHFATHTKNIEDLGGLIKKMPWTAFFFLVGSVSIAALPPFNGFISEWLTYQSLLLGYKIPSPAMQWIGPVGGAFLALTGALAAACFVKAFGITFLAQPRSHHAALATEVPFPMLLGMGILSVLCLVLGILPMVVIPLLDTVTEPWVGLSVTTDILSGGTALVPVVTGFSSVSPTVILWTLVAMVPLPWILFRWLKSPKGFRISETWNCGTSLTPRMEYTASAFSKPIKIIFSMIYRPKRMVHVDYNISRYFTRSMRYVGDIEPIFEKYLYDPLARGMIRLSTVVSRLESATIQAYLVYILITLVLLLVGLRVL